MFQFWDSIADGGPVLTQYCVFGIDSWNLSNATKKITVAILFKRKRWNNVVLMLG